MSGHNDSEWREETPVDETSPPDIQAQEDDAGKGFGVGGQIASITADASESRDDVNVARSGSTDDPGKGFGTGGDVKAPKT